MVQSDGHYGNRHGRHGTVSTQPEQLAEWLTTRLSPLLVTLFATEATGTKGVGVLLSSRRNTTRHDSANKNLD